MLDNLLCVSIPNNSCRFVSFHFVSMTDYFSVDCGFGRAGCHVYVNPSYKSVSIQTYDKIILSFCVS